MSSFSLPIGLKHDLDQLFRDRSLWRPGTGVGHHVLHYPSVRNIGTFEGFLFTGYVQTEGGITVYNHYPHWGRLGFHQAYAQRQREEDLHHYYPSSGEVFFGLFSDVFYM